MVERFDFVFSYWIFSWYLLYELGITSFNPKFALTIALFENIIQLCMMFYFKNTIINIIMFCFINLFIKIIPLWRLRNTNYNLIDVYATLILFIVLLLWMDVNDMKYTTFIEKSYYKLTHKKEGGPLTYYFNKYFTL